MLAVLTETRDRVEPTAADAARWRDFLDLGVTALAADSAWVRAWGGRGGSQHTYAVIDSRGIITWRVADGSATSVDAVIEAAEAAE